MRLKFAPGTDYGAFLRAHANDVRPGEAPRAALALLLIDMLDGDVTVGALKKVLDGRATFIVNDDGQTLRFVEVS